MLRRLSLVLPGACLFLGACATPTGHELASGPGVGDPNAKAIAIVSVTHDLRAGNTVDAIAYLDGGALSPGLPLESWPGADELDVRTSDFADRAGRLYVLDLEPGTHSITSWKLENRSSLRLRPTDPPPPLTFEVRAGEAVYLGNIHFALEMGRSRLGLDMVEEVAPVVRNCGPQDLAKAAARAPALQGRATPRLLPLGVWTAEEQGKAEHRSDPPPMGVSACR